MNPKTKVIMDMLMVRRGQISHLAARAGKIGDFGAMQRYNGVVHGLNEAIGVIQKMETKNVPENNQDSDFPN